MSNIFNKFCEDFFDRIEVYNNNIYITFIQNYSKKKYIKSKNIIDFHKKINSILSIIIINESTYCEQHDLWIFIRNFIEKNKLDIYNYSTKKIEINEDFQMQRKLFVDSKAITEDDEILNYSNDNSVKTPEYSFKNSIESTGFSTFNEPISKNENTMLKEFEENKQ